MEKSIGPINSIVLARAGESDKIYKKDQNSIDKNGLCELMIKENQFMNFNDRSDYLQELSDKLFGVEYYLNDFVSTGIMYYDILDMYNIKIYDKTYNCLMLNDEQLITQGLEENIHTDRPEKSETDYTKADKTDQKINQTTLIVDKQNQKIEALVTSNNELNQKTSQLRIDVNRIEGEISDIADVTTTVEGRGTIQADNINESEPIYIRIYPQINDITPLYPSNNLYPSDDLYPHNREIIFKNTSNNTNIVYNLPCNLYYLDGTYDEFIIDYANQLCYCIHRIEVVNGIKRIKNTPETENFTYPKISLTSGNYIITIPYALTTYIYVRLMTKNIYTSQYATKVELNSKISQTVTDITLETNKKLENYSTTTEMNSAITVKTNEIESQVNEKVGKTEVGTYIQQNTEAVKLAWNQISEFIQLMILNNNASFAILDSNKNVMMALDKKGQHFYETDGKTIFGDMGVQKEDNEQYIAFSVLSEYAQKISNGMAWGIKTKSDNIFHPIFYIKNFEMSEKDSDASYGELVLNSCNMILEGLSTGIISGNVKMRGDIANSAIQFVNTDTEEILFSISTNDLETGYPKLKILNNISFFQNVGGTNSFKLGNGNNYTLLEDDGSISCYGGNVIFGIAGREVNFDLYVKNLASIYGNLNVNGNIYANNISSDRRIKSNIQDSNIKALDIIKKIKHRQFDKKDDGKHYNVGYIAQEMEKLDKNFVIKKPATKTEEERYYINELPLIATMSKAIQELSQQVEELQNKLKEKEDK